MTTDSHAMTVSARMADFNWRRFLISFAISLTVLVVVAVAAAFAYARANDGRVLPGVSVAGVSVSGLDAGGVEAELRRQLPDLRAGGLLIQVGPTEELIAYTDIGRDYPMAAMIEQVMSVGRSGNPLDQVVQQVRTLLGAGVNIEPSVIYDVQALADRIAAVVAGVQVAPVNAAINFENGQYVVSPSRDGQSVDAQDALAQATAVVGSVSPTSATIQLQPTVVPAEIQTETAQAAVVQAQAIASGPLALAIADTSSVITTNTLLDWIVLEESSPGAWTVGIDRANIEAHVALLKAQFDQPAVEAEFRFEEGLPVAVPSQVGREMDALAANDLIDGALAQRAAGTTVDQLTLPVNATVPAFSTADAQALVSRVERLGAWTTNYTPSPTNNDGINIRRPASLIDGTVIQPGEIFDFVGIAGPITRANGYGDGAAIIGGNTKLDGVLGGGLCSASTTIYNAALRAGFEMGARRNHAYYISRYPVGLDATIWISGSYVQTMSFTNDTNFPIIIRSLNLKRSVTFEVWGVSDGRTVQFSPPAVTGEKVAESFYMFTDDLAPRELKRLEYPTDGFSSVVVRTVRDAAGSILHEDTIRSNYRKVDGIVLVGRYPGDPPAGTRIPFGELPPPPHPTPTPTPTPGPSPTPTPDPTPTPGPTAGFTKSAPSADGTVSFFDASTGGPTSWSWNFGDGSPGSSVQNPTHQYLAPGTYTVTLTVSNDLGSNSKSKTVTIPPPPPPPPTDTPAPP